MITRDSSVFSLSGAQRAGGTTLEVRVFDRKRSSLLIRIAAPGAVIGAIGAAALLGLPSTPSSVTQCSGTIAPDAAGPAAGNANPFDYSFGCASISPGATSPSGYNWLFDGNIYSYTIIVTRRKDDGSNVTYASPVATILNAGGVDLNADVNCTSFTPSDGFNCAAPGPNPSAATLGTYEKSIAAGDTVQGGFAMTDPYCAYLPKGAKAGTPAVPQAVVELLVTDDNGAQDGPFELYRSTPCKKIALVVPAKNAKKASAKAKKASKKVAK
jgi:hypothetical protein